MLSPQSLALLRALRAPALQPVQLEGKRFATLTLKHQQQQRASNALTISNPIKYLIGTVVGIAATATFQNTLKAPQMENRYAAQQQSIMTKASPTSLEEQMQHIMSRNMERQMSMPSTRTRMSLKRHETSFVVYENNPYKH
jgi:hypothetical protein